MKTGEAARVMGVDGSTIRNWIDHPDLNRFFSSEAQGDAGNPHRLLRESDVLILNTIRQLRTKGVTEWGDIAEKLDSGYRYQEFPQNAVSADPRLIPVPQAEQSARAAATMAERDSALAKVSELETFVNELKQRIAQKEAEIRELNERYRREMLDLQERTARERMEERLSDREEIGRLRAQVEMLRKQIDELKRLNTNDS